jgi:hypothetical protein
MNTRIVRATIDDEVCIADRHGAANEYLSLEYIPGTAWWGALAARTGILPGAKPTDEFVRVFYSSDVVFSNLYPATGLDRAHPIPLSARTWKPAPGFPGQGDVFVCEVNDRREPLDSLPPWDWLLDGIPAAPEPDWEPFGGWYRPSGKDSAAVAVSKVMRGHSETAPQPGVTREGHLFVRENIRRAQEFVGCLRTATNEAEAAVVHLLGVLGEEPAVLSLGRQPGSARIEIEQPADHPPDWQPAPDSPDDFATLTVTMLSDAILLDHWLRPVPFLSAGAVVAALGPDVNVAGPLHHFSALRPVFGWNGAHSRPRETEWVAASGSAFLYQLQWGAVVSEERRRRAEAWQMRGVGLRRAEGFGEIRLNDPFHRVYRAKPGRKGGHNA